MLREHSNTFRRVMIFVDLCVVAAAFFLEYYLPQLFPGIHELNGLNVFKGLLPLTLGIWGILFYFLGLYRSFRTKTIPEVIFIIFKSCIIGIFLFASIAYLVKIPGMGRMFIFLNVGITAIAISFEKIFVILVFRYFRDKGYNFRNILVVGTGRRAQELITMVNQHRGWGLKIVGLVDDEPEKVGQIIKGQKVLGTLNDLTDIIHKMVIDEVIFVIPWSWFAKLQTHIANCEIEGVKVHIAVDLYEPSMFSRLKADNLHTLPLLSIGSSTPDKLGALLFKRLFDIVMTLVGLVMLTPLLICIAVFIKLTSKGPVFFCQERYGLNGRKFTLYKFRTMVVDATERLKDILDKNEMKGPAFKLANDPRVTKVGKILRKFSLDELPQLWNILKGDMSLIGPRPPIPAEVAQYDAWQRRRLRMRPGLTCLWQVQGRNKITDFNEWAQLDLDYIDNWSLWLDLKILFQTIPVVVFGVGAK